MPYRVEMSCSQCRGDTRGCNEGSPWWLRDETGYIRWFASTKLANTAGEAEAGEHEPWEYEVIHGPGPNRVDGVEKK